MQAATIVPKYAAAYLTRDQRDARKTAVEVVLSDAPIDAAGATAALDPHMHVINQDALKHRNYVLLWVRPAGEVSMNATFSETMTQFVDATGDTLKAELTENTASRIAGRIFTAAPVKTMGGETYTVDLKFAVDVTRLPAATMLPAGGAEPGQAFTTFLAGARKKDWPAIKAGATDHTVAVFYEEYRSPEENADYALDLLNAWLPKAKLTVTGGERRGDVADLDIAGEMFPGTLAIYRVRMIKGGERWLFDSANVAGMVP